MDLSLAQNKCAALLEPTQIKPVEASPETLCMPKRLSNANCFVREPPKVNSGKLQNLNNGLFSSLQAQFPLYHFLPTRRPLLCDCRTEIRKAGGYDGLIQENTHLLIIVIATYLPSLLFRG